MVRHILDGILHYFLRVKSSNMNNSTVYYALVYENILGNETLYKSFNPCSNGSISQILSNFFKGNFDIVLILVLVEVSLKCVYTRMLITK